MRILSIDPSGNFIEGKGTTGFASWDGKKFNVYRESADDYDSRPAYYSTIILRVNKLRYDYVVCEDYRVYHHKGMKANTQANSLVETPRLIGVIEVQAYKENLPLTFQMAHQIKTPRWTDQRLVDIGILTKKGRSYYLGDYRTVVHERDALRHLLVYMKKAGVKWNV